MRDGAHASCDVTWVTSQGPRRRFMFEATVEIVMVQCGLFLTSGLTIQMLSFFLLFSMLSCCNRTPPPNLACERTGRWSHHALGVCFKAREKRETHLNARRSTQPPLAFLSRWALGEHTDVRSETHMSNHRKAHARQRVSLAHVRFF